MVRDGVSGRLPVGTVTFVFTDIEGSSSRWERDGGTMRDALAQHDLALREAIEGCGGSIVKHTGDGVMAVFAEAVAAIVAAVKVNQAVEHLVVRIGIHTGSAETGADGDYPGLTPTRAARVMSAAHGGQILVSGATATVAGVRQAKPRDLAQQTHHTGNRFVDDTRHHRPRFKMPTAKQRLGQPLRRDGTRHRWDAHVDHLVPSPAARAPVLPSMRPRADRNIGQPSYPHETVRRR